jgi:hypothetical protein
MTLACLTDSLRYRHVAGEILDETLADVREMIRQDIKDIRMLNKALKELDDAAAKLGGE